MVTDTATLAAALRAGMTLTDLQRRYEPNESASALLGLCAKLGGSPADALDRLSAVEAAHAKATAELQVAANGPKASARLVTMLPVLVLVTAQILGLKIFNELKPITLWSIGLGLALLFAGRTWSNLVISRAEPNLEDPGAGLDAFAVALSAGLPPKQALAEVEGIFGDQPTARLLISEASANGLAIAQLASAEAQRVRLRWRIEAEKLIQAASVRLMWPLGLLVLPAFVLVCIVPLAVALIRGN